MAVGLIKKQIIHSGGGVTTSPPSSPLRLSKRKQALKDAQTELDKQMGAFSKQEYVNPYAQAKNLMAGMTNVYEDLTVNQQQAQFEKQMFQEQQAGMMQGMAGAAGGSGVAGLAQAVLGQGQRQTQRIAASIGQQEQATQMAKARGARDVQSMEQAAQEKVMKGAFDVDVMTRKGEWEKEMQTRQGDWMADQARLQGAADARNMDLQKQQGLLAFQQGKLESEQAAKQADKNWFQRTFSDRKLKHNIVLIGKSPSGLNIYHFEYKDSKLGEGVYQGVMSDEISSSAVVKHPSGYDMVDYNKIDVDFIKIKN